jgi:signal transduction histidine kinase
MPSILVIEDELAVRSNILEMLEAEGFTVFEAEGGEAGVEVARRVRPDLILCDVMMADLDGYGVLAALRQEPETALIPFVFVTARSSRADLRQGMTSGADDYLTKPFTQQELLGAIASRISRHIRVQQLQTQVEALQHLNLLKDDFISAVSHDLRAPLMNMQFAIKMLQLASSPEQRDRYLDILRQECVREAELVNDLLDLQRLENGVDPLGQESIAIATWLEAEVERFELRTQAAGQELRTQIAADLPLVHSDRTLLGRIVTELLHNACKYTPRGGTIELRAGVVAGQLQLAIANSAEIPPEALPRLFDKFYRFPSSETQSGSGLGLTLVQQMVQLLQGTITVHSEAGWTHFLVALPLQGAILN